MSKTYHLAYCLASRPEWLLLVCLLVGVAFPLLVLPLVIISGSINLSGIIGLFAARHLRTPRFILSLSLTLQGMAGLAMLIATQTPTEIMWEKALFALGALVCYGGAKLLPHTLQPEETP